MPLQPSRRPASLAPERPDRHRAPRLAAGLASLLLPGLVACSDTPEPGDGEPTTCTLEDRTLRPGARAPLRDGATCSLCTCEDDGSLRCSPVACPDDAPDASEPDDATPPPDDRDTGDPPTDAGPPPDDAATDTAPPPPFDDSVADCACLASLAPSGEALAFALGACGDALTGATFAGDPAQARVVPEYYGIRPPTGACMAVLSTGRADQVPETGSAFAPAGAQPGTSFQEAAIFPNPRPAGGPAVHDLARLDLELVPPPGARGIEFQFLFLSAEWPEYLCQEFNDTFLALLDSRANPGGGPTNISFDANGNEVSVNIGFFEGPAEWTVDLSDTPFGLQPPPPILDLPFPGLQADACPGQAFRGGCSLPEYCDDGSDLNYIGSATGWLRSAAPIDPSEDTIRLSFTLHDEGDAAYDSMVLIQGLRWLGYTPDTETEKL